MPTRHTNHVGSWHDCLHHLHRRYHYLFHYHCLTSRYGLYHYHYQYHYLMTTTSLHHYSVGRNAKC